MADAVANGGTADTKDKDRPLRLAARDADDLQVLSSVLQDALIPLNDWSFDQRNAEFVGVLNRFRWERGADGVPVTADGASAGDASEEDASEDGASVAEMRHERVLCGLRIAKVRQVQRRGFGPGDKVRPCNLLALNWDGSWLTLDFAGGGSIRLRADDLDCQLSDLGEPWPTQWRPDHPESAENE